MALIKCPECGKEISEKAPACIHCGYPLDLIKDETTAEDSTKEDVNNEGFSTSSNKVDTETNTSNISTTTTNSTNKQDDSGTGCLVSLALMIVAIIVGVWLIVDSLDGFVWSVIIPYIIAVPIVGFALYSVFSAIANGEETKKNWDKEKYNNYQFTCPMCGSKKVKKISNMNRSVSVATMGLASSKIGKQYECDDCKHKW